MLALEVPEAREEAPERERPLTPAEIDPEPTVRGNGHSGWLQTEVTDVKITDRGRRQKERETETRETETERQRQRRYRPQYEGGGCRTGRGATFTAGVNGGVALLRHP